MVLPRKQIKLTDSSKNNTREIKASCKSNKNKRIQRLQETRQHFIQRNQKSFFFLQKGKHNVIYHKSKKLFHSSSQIRSVKIMGIDVITYILANFRINNRKYFQTFREIQLNKVFLFMNILSTNLEELTEGKH